MAIRLYLTTAEKIIFKVNHGDSPEGFTITGQNVHDLKKKKESLSVLLPFLSKMIYPHEEVVLWSMLVKVVIKMPLRMQTGNLK